VYLSRGTWFQSLSPLVRQHSCYIDQVENIGPNTAGSNGHLNRYVAEVIQRADKELRHLMAKRAELTKRIGTVKRTMVGLAKLFGDDNMDALLLGVVDQGRGPRHPGDHGSVP